MSPAIRATAAVLGFVAGLAWGPSASAQGSQPAAAEAQLRLAQRLAADRSPDAGPAFEKVLAMANGGPLADDALLGLARLQGVPDWPEALAGLDAARAAAALAPLSKLLEARPEGDRAREARYLRALVRLAPVAGRDAASAKQDLIAVASLPGGGRWAAMARYAIGVVAEQEGASDRAAGSYARVVVEEPASELAARARVGFARAELRAEHFGEAAAWLQAALDGGAPPSLRAAALRELAVGGILRGRDPARRWSAGAGPLAAIETTRGSTLLATASDGGIVVFDGKNAALQVFDVRGAGGPPLAHKGVTAMTSDPYRRVYVAAGDKLLRWEGPGLVVVAPLGSFTDASAIVVDASGTTWIADRRGDRIGRLAAGGEAPVVVRERKGNGVSALALLAGRVVVAEEKTGRVVELSENGAERPLGPAFRRPVSLAVDAGGRLSVLDLKAGTVTRLAPGGEVRDTLSLEAAGVTRPLAIAAADDGAVRILDGSRGAVAVAP